MEQAGLVPVGIYDNRIEADEPGWPVVEDVDSSQRSDDDFIGGFIPVNKAAARNMSKKSNKIGSIPLKNNVYIDTSDEEESNSSGRS
jgi:hypothetical protein